MVVCVIGGGASGMAAALAAAERPGVQVLLLERQARVGRKLQATGNGRCNLTNLHAGESGYHGECVDFASPALDRYGVEDTLEWFRGLGLFTVAEESGRVYPYTDHANSVVDVLRFALERAGVQVHTGFEVSRLRKTETGFCVESAERSVECDRVIIACGGLAGTKLGGSMSGYQLLRGMGHRMTKLRPTLVQLKSDWGQAAALKGIRTHCRAAVFRDGQLHAQSEGELQFTQYGLSGPVIFEVSRDACYGKGNWLCRLDFLPNMEKAELKAELLRRKARGCTAEELAVGILHNRLGAVLLKCAGADLDALCDVIKGLEIPLVEPMGMDHAQVTAGGIVTEDFCPDTMESKLVGGLYACGEVLDIDGDCGGYNLQWAWSSGRLAGYSAGKELA